MGPHRGQDLIAGCHEGIEMVVPGAFSQGARGRGARGSETRQAESFRQMSNQSTVRGQHKLSSTDSPRETSYVEHTTMGEVGVG